MDINNCREHLRKAILAISPVHDKAIVELQQLFNYEQIKAGDFFCRAGDYSLYFAFICHGLFSSYYNDAKEKEHCTGLFTRNMFMLPLPSFIYRKPAFQFFQAIQDSAIIKCKYADIENIARKQSSVKDFLRILIDKEWIVRKELILAGKYIYDYQSRFQIFLDQYHEVISQIPVATISSYLSIPEKQLHKLMDKENLRAD